jgi:two-component system NtrC family sensor kinase
MEPSRRSLHESEKMDALVQLAGTVAHELNNIFTAVAGNLSLLDQDFSGEQSVTYQDIVRAAQRGIDLTAKLQAFAGRQRLDRRSIDLNAVVSRTLARLHHTLSDVTLDVALGDTEFIVYADEQKLSDTVAELIKNARTAMPHGGGHLSVRTQRFLRGNLHPQVILSIADNGSGMTPDVMARAAEPLFTTAPHGIKAGWELSNCAGFVRQSGGTITLTSEPGRGTTVQLSLPLENVPAVRDSPASGDNPVKKPFSLAP